MELESIIPVYNYTYTHYTYCILTFNNVFILIFFIFIQYKVPDLPYIKEKSKETYCGSGGGGGGGSGWEVCGSAIIIN